MNITQEKIDELNSILKVEVTAEDYQEKVDKILKENQKKMKLPGFRPGKIPASLVKKMYGKAVLVDEINKIVIDSMYDYLGQNNIDILGNPLPNKEKSKDINWDLETNFDFHFDIGHSPQFDMEPLEKMKVKYYEISVNDQVIDKYLTDMRKRYGKFSSPEESADGDLIYAEFEELDKEGNVNEAGIKNKGSVAIDLIKNKTIKKKFIGLKKDDSIDINIVDTFENPVEISHLLGIETSKVAELNKIFRVKVLSINHIELAALDNELFEKVYKNDNITSEEQLKEKIKQDAQASFANESDRKFVSDIVDLLIKNTKIVLPDTFLKRWLLETNSDKFTAEQIEKEYSIYTDSLKWQLIENKLFKENDIKVTNEDIKEYIKNYFRKSMPVSENNEFPEERLDELAERFLQNKEETKKIYDALYDERMKEIFKSKVKMNKEEVTYEEFVKMNAEKHDHEHEHHDHEHDHDHKH
ncbi:MAG: trigger factor [Bacteroidetes bacterium]|nr:trigger factor [Bacteroidota bacterium]